MGAALVHGREVGYRLEGQGPLIVLVHGMAGSRATWDLVVPALAERFAVLALDLPGHGSSAKPIDGDYSLGSFASIVRDLIVTLGHDRATIVGQSLGGGVAMQFAYQFPSRCERLVLVGSGGLGREVSPLLRALAFPGVEFLYPVLFASMLRNAGRTVLGGLRKIGLRPSAYVNQMWLSYESLTEPETRAAFARTLRSVVDVTGQRVSAHDRLPLAEEIPTLIVWGANDAIIPSHHAAAAHATLPSSRGRDLRRGRTLPPLRGSRALRTCAHRLHRCDRARRRHRSALCACCHTVGNRLSLARSTP